MTEQPTLPALNSFASHTIIHPAWTDPATGATYVHRDLEVATGPWENAEHIPPARDIISFGDIASWADYVHQYGTPATTLATWNADGLRAILDYHLGQDSPGRCQWTASMPFLPSGPWLAWGAFANGHARSQREVIEQLEDLADDVREPSAADLVHLLSDLRAGVNTEAETLLRPDGTTQVSFSRNEAVRSKELNVVLPSVLTLAITPLRGDDIPWEVRCRLRVSIDDKAHLQFRFSLVNAEGVMDQVIHERAQEARALLAEGYILLRRA